MKRRARAVPFARRRLDSVIRDLAAAPVATWSKHLRIARNILTDELAVEEKTAKAAVIASFCAGHKYGQAINQRSRDFADFTERLKFRKAFMRIAKCARRSSATLRHILDRRVHSTTNVRVVDSEVVEALVQALFAAFARFPTDEPSLTVLRTIIGRSSVPEATKAQNRNSLRRCFADASDRLKQDYSALRALDQRAVERALTSLQNDNAEFKAADVCDSISAALEGDKRVKAAIHDLITDYVLTIALIWVKHGFKPYRSTRESKANYRGKFHRFADIVLTAAVEPYSRRHDGTFQELLAALRKAHAQVPSDIRKFVRCAPRRSDVEWLVSDDHVKVALTQLKKRPLKLHTGSSRVTK